MGLKEAKQHPTKPDLWITPDGRVFQELPASPDSFGYAQISVGGRGQKRAIRRHILVCETFHGVRQGRAVVRHKNGVPGDDHKDNLMWGTQAENCADTVAHGKSTKGMRNAQALLTDANVREIKQRLRDGESQRQIAESFGIRQPTVSDIKRGLTWSHIE